jgi:transposase
MPKDKTPGKPTTRRYTEEEKTQAVRLVRQLRRELGTEHGTIQRVAEQLGYGVETVRKWVRDADVDEGLKAGTSSEDRAKIKALEQEVRELRRANSILKSASAFFAAELDRPQR